MEGEMLDVLVVSKEEGATLRTVGLLERHGFAARPAADEGEALGEARVALPDVVLVDLTSGVSAALARSIRGCAVGKQPLVIAVADRPAGINNRAAADAGVDLHLVAPVHPAVIVRILKRFQRGLSLTPVLKHHNEVGRTHLLSGTANTNSASSRFLGAYPMMSGSVFVARAE